MKTLYPSIEPFQQFFLQTDSIHSVYVEQSGNPNGIPIIFLHGGPCSGTKPYHRCFFNPEKYHIILMDQRGSGKSTPFGETEHNTTHDLIADMEQLRIQLNIKQWLLFGGSWGAALSLLYAEQHPERVLSMILRGTFLARAMDGDWFLNTGAGRIYPEYWQQLHDSIWGSTEPRFIDALHRAVFGDDELAQHRVTSAWNNWGAQVALLDAYKQPDNPHHVNDKMIKQVQMEIHYAKHNYFIAENQILNQAARLKEIPTIIVHGRKDLVCPIEAGFSLHKQLPHAQFITLANSGHIASGDEMIHTLVNATDRMIEN